MSWWDYQPNGQAFSNGEYLRWREPVICECNVVGREMMARRGRKPKSREQKLKDALERTAPPAHIAERRRLFSFVTPSTGPDGRVGEIDQDICDAIGQLHALGLLDGHGYDSTELRDKGRFWGGHYARLLKGSAAKTANYERRDRSQPSHALTGEDLMFDRMDESLPSFERDVLLSLVVDPLIGSWPCGRSIAPWAQALIDEALLARNRVPAAMVFPTANDRELLRAAIRALCILCEGSVRPPVHRKAA